MTKGVAKKLDHSPYLALCAGGVILVGRMLERLSYPHQIRGLSLSHQMPLGI